MRHFPVTTDFSEAAEPAHVCAKEQVQLIGKEKSKITLLKGIISFKAVYKVIE